MTTLTFEQNLVRLANASEISALNEPTALFEYIDHKLAILLNSQRNGFHILSKIIVVTPNKMVMTNMLRDFFGHGDQDAADNIIAVTASSLHNSNAYSNILQAVDVFDIVIDPMCYIELGKFL